MFILRITLQSISDEMGAGFIKPSLIKIFILDQLLNVTKEVICIKWDGEVLLRWLFDNRHDLLSDFFPGEAIEDHSIAAAIHDFYGNVDPENIDLMDRMFAYRESHGIRFALRGVDIPDVYIGKRRGGNYEISCADPGNMWMFEIDLQAFFDSLAAEYA